MPKELREYQLSLVDRVIRAYDAGERRICLVSPTGSGKTIVAAELIKQFVSRGLRVMFQVHLDCLIGQTRSKLWDMGYRDKRHTGFIKAELQENRGAPLQIASQQTLLRRDWWQIRQFDVFFFDECHTTAFGMAADKTRKNFPDALYIGLTATPMRMKKTEGLADHFDLCIAAPVPRELMELGHLASMDYYSLPLDFIDLSRVRMTGGDFNTGELGVACNHPQSIDRCFEEYQKHGQNQPALIFAVTVNHAKALAKRFHEGGVNTEVVTAKTPSTSRSQIYSAFKKGEIQALASVNCISTGFDVPNATVGIVARPTKSEGLWYQIVGRLMRPAPGKTKGIILDIAGNAWRFGIPDHIEEYSLDFSQLTGSGEPPLKTCESCGLLNLIFAKVCRNCGAEFPVLEKKPVTRPLVLYHEGDLPQGREEEASDASQDGVAVQEEERHEEAIAVKGDLALYDRSTRRENWMKPDEADVQLFQETKRRAFALRQSPGYAAVQFKKQRGFYPDHEWELGAVFQGNCDLLQLKQYYSYLRVCTSRKPWPDPAKKDYIRREMIKEFGTTIAMDFLNSNDRQEVELDTLWNNVIAGLPKRPKSALSIGAKLERIDGNTAIVLSKVGAFTLDIQRHAPVLAAAFTKVMGKKITVQVVEKV